jgi:transposase
LLHSRLRAGHTGKETFMALDPTLHLIVGVDVGADQAAYRLLTPRKTSCGQGVFAQTAAGYAQLIARLTKLGIPPDQTLVALEATGIYWENLYYFFAARGYRLLLLHPAQTHQFAAQRGLRAKTDRLDAETIARLVFSDEVRPAYVPSAEIVSYREVLRLQARLTEEAARLKIEIRTLLEVLFPEFTSVWADPTGVTARAVLAAYPSAAAVQAAGVDAVAAVLADVAAHRYGRETAARLVEVAAGSVSSGVARAVRERSLRIAVAQYGQVAAHLAGVEQELAGMLRQDAGLGGLRTVPEFGPQTVAVLRAELGEVGRFAGTAQVIAYLGLDLRVRQSGKWRGQEKLSKRGSGHARKLLYLAAVRSIRAGDSEFGAYYRHLVEKGVATMSALMAVMRKMAGVAYRLLKTGEAYDPRQVWAGAQRPPGPAAAAA